MAAMPEYEAYAIRYATREGRRIDHFISGDPHDGPMPMDYFVWVVRSGRRAIVIDSGFNAQVAAKRKRTFLRCPVETLSLLQIDPADVEDVVITHLHNDHAGNLGLFPNARFHLQEREMAYATGKYMRYSCCGHSFEVEDVVRTIRLNFDGRVEFHDGEAQVAPGVTLHPAGGHTDGLQFVRVWTRRGWVVLASDATHYYENIQTNRPVRVVFNVGDALDAFRAVERLADGPEHIIPGHDPLVMQRYPAPRPDLHGIIARLD